MRKKLKIGVPTDPGKVGAFGGRGPRDLMNPGVNAIQRPSDPDRGGDKDGGVSKELSEDQNRLLRK